MLSIVILVAIATTFSKLAFDKNLNRYLWGTIGVISFYLAQIIGGVVLAAIDPELLQNNGAMLGYGLLFGFMGAGIAYFILNKMTYPNENEVDDNDLLDNSIK